MWFPDPIRPAQRYMEVYGAVERFRPAPVEEWAAEMREAGIVKAVIAASDNETVWRRKVPHEHIAELCRQYPDLFVGFAGADPHKGLRAVAEMERAVKEYGFKGVDLQPWLHQIPIDDAKYFPIYAKAAELGIVVFMHCSVHFDPGVPMDLDHPLRLDRVAAHFPELNLVARHAGWPWILDMVAVAWRHHRVYLEISGIRPRHIHPELMRYFDNILQDKVVFGTSYPMLPFKRTVDEFRELTMRENVKEKILYHNAARLLGLAA